MANLKTFINPISCSRISAFSFLGIFFIVSIYVPIINQAPNYMRGCEVVSLQMLLAHAGIEVTTDDLIAGLKFDETPYTLIDGRVHFGNPYLGFVGDIYTFKNPGLGVYYPPIYNLMANYIRPVNLSEQPFSEIEKYLDSGKPVWVIVNAKYDILEESDFEDWETPAGTLKITKWMHAVVLTGYSETEVFFADPLNKKNNALKENFVKAWEQLGSQALSY